MTIEKISVFISSTSDLHEEREAVKEVCHELRIEPFDYKDVPANSSSPEKLLIEQIARAEVFVGVLGGRYGSLYPPKNECSVVEFEINQAQVRRGARLTAIFPKLLPPQKVEPLQEEFRSRISDIRGIWIKTFDSVENLKTEVRRSITNWLADWFIKRKHAEEPDVDASHRKVKAVAGILAGIAALVSLVFTITPLGPLAHSAAICVGSF